MKKLLIVSVLFSVNVFADEKAVQRVEGYLSNVQSLEGEFQETIVDERLESGGRGAWQTVSAATRSVSLGLLRAVSAKCRIQR